MRDPVTSVSASSDLGERTETRSLASWIASNAAASSRMFVKSKMPSAMPAYCWMIVRATFIGGLPRRG
jgi:hypothetical protein